MTVEITHFNLTSGFTQINNGRENTRANTAERWLCTKIEHLSGIMQCFRAGELIVAHPCHFVNIYAIKCMGVAPCIVARRTALKLGLAPFKNTVLLWVSDPTTRRTCP